MIDQNINHVNKKGFSAYHYAAQSGNVKILELLDSQCIENQTFTNAGQNALHIACHKGNTSCVEYLLEKAGFNPNVLLKQKTQSTSLHLACKQGHFKIAEYLVDHSYANLR